MSLPTLREPLQDLKVYEAKNKFYIVGRNVQNNRFHILHIGRGTQADKWDNAQTSHVESNLASPAPMPPPPPPPSKATSPQPQRTGLPFAGLFGGPSHTKAPTDRKEETMTDRLVNFFGGGNKEESAEASDSNEAEQKEAFSPTLPDTPDINDPGKLKLFQEPQDYSAKDLEARLKELQKKSPGEEFNFVCSACGILGFIKLLYDHMLVLITQRKKVGVLFGNYIYTIKQTKTIHLNKRFFLSKESRDEARFRNLLASLDLSKDFYFSYGYDLTNTLQSLVTEGGFGEAVSCPPPEDTFLQCNTMYAWNFYMMTPIVTAKDNELDPQDWMLPVVHGFLQQRLIHIGGESLRISLISRRSRHFAGTRYLRRGVNERGYCANEVETEQIISLDTNVVDKETRVTSMVQIRGSIPLFWSHRNITSPKPDIVVHEDKGLDATYKHFRRVVTKFGGSCTVLNLIRQKEKKPIELLLFAKINDTMKELTSEKPPNSNYEKMPLEYICYDFINNTRLLGENALDKLDEISQSVFPRMGFFSYHANQLEGDHAPQLNEVRDGKRCQSGVLRTNCIDCLDRTNIAQFCYGRLTLKSMLDDLNIQLDANSAAEVDQVFMEMFVLNGDTIARQYGGSPSMHRLVAEDNEDFEGNKEFAVKGGMKNAMIATQRYISNNFMDAERQQAMDLFLGITIPRKATIIERMRRMSMKNIEDIPILDESGGSSSIEKTKIRKASVSQAELQELEKEMEKQDELEIRAEEEAHSAWLLEQVPVLRTVVHNRSRLCLNDATSKLVSFDKMQTYDFNIPNKIEVGDSPTDGISPNQANFEKKPPNTDSDLNLSRKLMKLHSKRSSLALGSPNSITREEPPLISIREAIPREKPFPGGRDSRSSSKFEDDLMIQSNEVEEFYTRYIQMDNILNNNSQKKPKAKKMKESKRQLLLQRQQSWHEFRKELGQLGSLLHTVGEKNNLPQGAPQLRKAKTEGLERRKKPEGRLRIRPNERPKRGSLTEESLEPEDDGRPSTNQQGFQSTDSDSDSPRARTSISKESANEAWLVAKLDEHKSPLHKEPGYETFSELMTTSRAKRSSFVNKNDENHVLGDSKDGGLFGVFSGNKSGEVSDAESKQNRGANADDHAIPYTSQLMRKFRGPVENSQQVSSQDASSILSDEMILQALVDRAVEKALDKFMQK